MLTIWLISKYATPPHYGIGSRLFNLGNEYNKLGHPTTLITSDSNHFAEFPKTNKIYNTENHKDTKIIWINTLKYKNSASLRRVLSWLDFEIKLFLMPLKKSSKPDVVVVSSLSLFTILYGYYLKLRFKSKLIFEVRDIWPLTMVVEGNFSKHHPLVIIMGIIEKFGYQVSDLIVGTMPNLKEHVRNILGYEKNVFCSPLGFDEERINHIECDKLPASKYNFPKNKLIVGYAGSIGISNALDEFFEAVLALKDDADIYFVVAGSGQLLEKYQKLTQECKNIKFFGRIPFNEIIEFNKACDVLYLAAHPSEIWKYGQSLNKIIDYMLSGKPILASYSGYQSMINEAGCGKFIEAKNKDIIIESLLNFAQLPKEELENMGKKGKLWLLENRSYRILALKYLGEILKVTSKT